MVLWLDTCSLLHHLFLVLTGLGIAIAGLSTFKYLFNISTVNFIHYSLDTGKYHKLGYTSKARWLCSVSLHLKGTWETQNHQKFCMRLVLVSFTINLQQTLHDHLKSLSDSKPPVLVTRGPRDRSHDVSVYETCACVIINLLSYMCI